ncbi:30S ribosomal protein THX [Hymenobacter weizhouensis]|nr:30S ribosomal protein THX [Hymenobacter sp. YIM 151500-1]UYZ61757.1 30S ribosomal protein THX [Hymenobacter sp. YIM 151500-1]
MGKGDIKTKRGKRTNGSFGVHRKRKKAGKAAAPKAATPKK